MPDANETRWTSWWDEVKWWHDNLDVMIDHLREEMVNDEHDHSCGIEELYDFIDGSSKPDMWRLRLQLQFAINDLSIIKTKMVQFQSSAFSLFQSVQAFRDTFTHLERVADSETHLSPQTRQVLDKAPTKQDRKKMVDLMKECASEGVKKMKFYRDEWWSTKASFAALFCISCLDPRNHADIPASQTFVEMGKYLRGMWDAIVNGVEWDRYRRLTAHKLKQLCALPTKASDVIAWWANDVVK
eukprot:gene12693-37791_t